MTGEQYVRANKRVYNVVIILLAVMTILSVMAVWRSLRLRYCFRLQLQLRELLL